MIVSVMNPSEQQQLENISEESVIIRHEDSSKHSSHFEPAQAANIFNIFGTTSPPEEPEDHHYEIRVTRHKDPLRSSQTPLRATLSKSKEAHNSNLGSFKLTSSKLLRVENSMKKEEVKQKGSKVRESGGGGWGREGVSCMGSRRLSCLASRGSEGKGEAGKMLESKVKEEEKLVGQQLGVKECKSEHELKKQLIEVGNRMKSTYDPKQPQT